MLNFPVGLFHWDWPTGFSSNKVKDEGEGVILPRFSGEGIKCMTSKQEEIHYVIREGPQAPEFT